MQRVTVRPAVEADVGNIGALVADLARERQHDADIQGIESAVVECVQLSGSEIFVAEAGSEIIGYVAVHWIPFPMLLGREAYVSDLIVRATWRGHGLGNRLLETVEQRAKDVGCLRLMLNNRVASDSFERGFFSKLGFRQRSDFVNMVKTISGAGA